MLAEDLPTWLDDLVHANGGSGSGRPCAIRGYRRRRARELDPAQGIRADQAAATALELLHQFALLHDDVMDEIGSAPWPPSQRTVKPSSEHAAAGARGDSAAFGRNLAVTTR